jgi:hypothetical protein
LISRKYYKKNYEKNILTHNPESRGISQLVTAVIKAASAAGRKLFFIITRLSVVHIVIPAADL